jgi:hypothetical protein
MSLSHNAFLTMKTKLSLLFLVSFIFYLSSAQVPQGFNYQAVARDASGNPIVNAAMPVRITIQSDSLGGTLFWQELHNSVITNSFGLINVVLGKGAKVTGLATTFNAIDWSVTPKFIKTEINYGGWKNMGSSRLWSVPYSMIAGDLGGPVKKLAVTGKTSVMDEALFEVKNKDGNTVFAVYNEGVRVYVADGAKGLKGGFAVGGFGSDKAESQKYLVVSKDSTRIYVDSNPSTKKLKGGFAVGGYDMTKGVTVQDYLDVNADSVRIYIDSDPSTKKTKGGFAVGGYDMTKGTNTNYMNVNTDSKGIINPAQNRVLWYPIKNAFLAGRIRIGTPDSVGENSFATGYQSKSRGKFSQSMGFKTIANGDYSTSIGKNAVASMTNSFAFGDSPVASGIDSYAFGAGATAYGKGSYALGSIDRDTLGNTTGAKTTAWGDYSFAIGQGAVTSNTSAFAFGASATASGKGSSAFGLATAASGTASTSIGFGTAAKGEYSTALGSLTRSYGTASTSMGLFTEAKGDASTAMGMLTSATGQASTALGYSSATNADNATAMGYGTLASGIGSTAMGLSTSASGTGSTSMGSSTVASGYFSTALGYNTTAQCFGSLVIGRYNTYSGLSDEWNFWDPVFVIGNGSSSETRSNALTVYKNGIADLGWFINLNKTSTGEALKVSDAQAIWYDGTYFSWGYGGTYNVFADKVSVGTTANPGSYSLYVAGSAYSTGSFISASDIRWKKNIAQMGSVLDKVILLNGVTYKWRNDEFPEIHFESGTQIGLIAQEVEKIFPELVKTDDKGYKGVNYDKLSVLLLEGMKEQQKQIEFFKNENQQLRSELQSLNDRMEKVEALLTEGDTK